MSDNSQFSTLISPFQIREVKLKNRIVKPPQMIGITGSDGGITEDALPYYESLAKGGVGLIVMEGTAVDYPLGVFKWPSRLINDDKFIPGYSKVTELVHSCGGKIIMQLFHAGPSHAKALSGMKPLSASALTGKETPAPVYPETREITIPEIKEIQLKFIEAAKRAHKAGFDGVELHAAHRYIFNSFLSGASNKRKDQYGGAHENRARIVSETIKAIKELLGRPDFVVGVRFNGQEWGLNNGITIEDSKVFARLFEEAGADYLHISGYGYGGFLWGYWPEQLNYLPSPEVKPFLKSVKTPGFIVSAAEKIKQMVSIPVISGGRIDPSVAEEDLAKAKIDLVYMGRRLFADPDLPNKVAEGRLSDIAPCTACRECWESAITRNIRVQCRINAALLKEAEYDPKPAQKRKRVLVAGGGPAGMEAARVAAVRGHEVILYEQEHQLGGKLHLAGFIKGSEVEDLGEILHYLGNQLNKLAVEVRLGQQVSLPVVERVKPDAVIIATGGKTVLPEIPGIDNKKVVKAASLYRQSRFFLRHFGPDLTRELSNFWMPFGKRIVIIGGDIQGLQLAEFLVRRGREVTVVEASDKFGANMVAITANQLVPWLIGQGVTMLSEVKYEEITDKGLVITGKEGKKQTIEADNILPALPLSVNAELFEAIAGKVPEIYQIGDCRDPQRIIHAIHDGSRIGCLV